MTVLTMPQRHLYEVLQQYEGEDCKQPQNGQRCFLHDGRSYYVLSASDGSK